MRPASSGPFCPSQCDWPLVDLIRRNTHPLLEDSCTLLSIALAILRCCHIIRRMVCSSSKPAVCWRLYSLNQLLNSMQQSEGFFGGGFFHLFSPGERDHSPLAIPCPLPRPRIPTTTLQSAQLLVLPRRQSHHNISLTSAQRHDIKPRSRAKRSNRLDEGRRCIPFCLIHT